MLVKRGDSKSLNGIWRASASAGVNGLDSMVLGPLISLTTATQLTKRQVASFLENIYSIIRHSSSSSLAIRISYPLFPLYITALKMSIKGGFQKKKKIKIRWCSYPRVFSIPLPPLVNVYFYSFTSVWKILIFGLLHFFTFFSTHQKTLPGKFWNFFDHWFKRYWISVFHS